MGSPIKISFMCPYDREVADEVADQDVDMPTAIEMTGADESLNGWYILDITKYRYYHTDPKPRFSKVGPCHCNKPSSGKLMWAEPQPRISATGKSKPTDIAVCETCQNTRFVETAYIYWANLSTSGYGEWRCKNSFWYNISLFRMSTAALPPKKGWSNGAKLLF